jgi:hypothetical protein
MGTPVIRSVVVHSVLFCSQGEQPPGLASHRILRICGKVFSSSTKKRALGAQRRRFCRRRNDAAARGLGDETRTLQRSQACPVLLELWSFFFTEREKSLGDAFCVVGKVGAVIACSSFGNLGAELRWLPTLSRVLFGPMVSGLVRRDSPWTLPSVVLQTPATGGQGSAPLGTVR